MQTKEPQTKWIAANALLRTMLFILYYLFLIAVGIGIVCLFTFASRAVIENVKFSSGGIWIYIFMTFMWLFAGMFVLFFIKPLFKFTHHSDEGRVRITRNNCPALFNMLENVAKESGCELPKRIYLTAQVGASANFDTSFWKLFMPSSRELEIGLGLFEVMNQMEIKGILAHELNHFKQKETKVSNWVWMANAILYDLVYEEDFWDRWLKMLCQSSVWILAFIGLFLDLITGSFRQAGRELYMFTQKGFYKLSRSMEYNADKAGYACAGKEAYISMLCKYAIQARYQEEYNEFLRLLIDEEGKSINDYMKGATIASQCLEQHYRHGADYTHLMKTHSLPRLAKSRIQFKDPWASHPEIDERIAQINAYPSISIDTGNLKKAWELVPEEVVRQVSEKYTSQIYASVPQDLPKMKEEEFKSWIENKINLFYMAKPLEPYFERQLNQFDITTFEHTTESPFTKANEQLLAEQEQAIEDNCLLMDFELNKLDIDRIYYNGKGYRREDKQLYTEHENYLQSLERQATAIDRKIFAYLMSKASTTEQEQLQTAYKHLFEATKIHNRHTCNQWTTYKIYVTNWLHQFPDPDLDRTKELAAIVQEYEANLRYSIDETDTGLFPPETAQQLKDYAKTEHNPQFSLQPEAINEMFYMTDVLRKAARNLYYSSRKQICDIAYKYLSLQ